MIRLSLFSLLFLLFSWAQQSVCHAAAAAAESHCYVVDLIVLWLIRPVWITFQ